MKELCTPPVPLPQDQQMSPEDFAYALTNIDPIEIVMGHPDAGYFLPGDTVELTRSSGELDKGWAFAGMSSLVDNHGLFVKIIDGHRARKLYPIDFNQVD